MNRITVVELRGYKGQHRRFELGERTLLTGPNGLGKSAVLEGIIYALSGEVPSGKALDEVGKFFPERGGFVSLTDSDGNRITRGIARDHEKQKVSEELQLEPPDTDWYANEALLDMKSFLALSANRRREFVLELVGAGERPTDAQIHQALAAGYAKEIGGPGADVSILDGRKADLPEDIRPLAERWGSLWSVLSSYLRTGEETASAIFQRLADVARDRKNAARHAATEARAAIRELEAAAKGARAAAEDLERRRYDAEAAQDAFAEAREKGAERRGLERATKDAEEECAQLAVSLEASEKAFAKLPDSGSEPSPEEPEDQAPGLRRQLEALRLELADAEKHRAFLAALEDRQKAATKQLARTMAEIDEHERSPVGRAVFLAEQIRAEGGGHGSALVAQLLGVVDEIAGAWQKRNEQLILRMLDEQQAVGSLEKDREDVESVSAGSIAELTRGCVDLAARLEQLEKGRTARETERTKALRSREAAARDRSAFEREIQVFRSGHESASRRLQDAQERLAALPPYPDVREAEERAYTAKRALQAAEEAAGAVKAYEEALQRAEDGKVAEAAWKAAEAASKRARETYVAEVVRPLVDDVAALLAAAGRSERVYLSLENERGKPVFDLGWCLGASRRSLSALSGGESILFTASLAVTIARRTVGRRVLLVEADPLDDRNLIRLLEALRDFPVELDACLVATSSPVDEAPGWRVIRFEDAL